MGNNWAAPSKVSQVIKPLLNRVSRPACKGPLNFKHSSLNGPSRSAMESQKSIITLIFWSENLTYVILTMFVICKTKFPLKVSPAYLRLDCLISIMEILGCLSITSAEIKLLIGLFRNQTKGNQVSKSEFWVLSKFASPKYDGKSRINREEF